MNKTGYILLIFLIMYCCACSNGGNNRRSDILPLDSVAVIIADSYFLESEIYVSQWKNDVSDYSFSKYDYFFEKYGLTKETYLQNIRFYLTNKKYADKIMDKVDRIVELRLAALRDSLNME
jgi:hypothetical protein